MGTSDLGVPARRSSMRLQAVTAPPAQSAAEQVVVAVSKPSSIICPEPCAER